MIIGVIGAGRVGATLAAAFRLAGHEVVAGFEPAAHLILVAIPDDALPEVVAGLPVRHGQIVAHTSGAHGIGVLRPVVDRGGRPLALHPAMTFTGTAADLDRLPGVSYGVTAPDDLRAMATRLVADLGGVPEWIAEDQRALYHAALAHGANHLVTLVNEAADRLRDAGVRRPEKVLAPLLDAALHNALKLGDEALTGPVSRGDAGTVARHVAALAGSGSLPAYLALARRTADRAIASGRLSATDAEELLDVLAAEVTR